METKVCYSDLGLMEYKQAWEHQEVLFDKIIEQKTAGQPTQSHLLFCEHPHVYTLGKSGTQNNLLVNDEFLKKINATFFRTNRGGDITYHGPGQIVGYPVFNLENFDLHIKQYIYNLEEVIICTLRDYSIDAHRLDGATGVWLDVNKPQARKICAIGVKASRYVTMHGFAFNINTDLTYFNYINPCGFVDKGVTSLSKELHQIIDIEIVKSKLKHYFEQIFKMKLI